jgi:hypothetical protein
VLLHRWGSSAGCQLIADRLERGFFPLCGVVNDAAVYFIMIGGGFLGSIDEILLFYRWCGRIGADERGLRDVILWVVVGMEEAVFWLCGVVNYAGVYFGMIRGGFLGSLDEIFIFYRWCGRIGADGRGWCVVILWVVVGME